MVDLLGRYKLSVTLAQLTHRVLLHIAVPDALPHTTVATAGFRISVVLFVSLGFSLGVFLTESTVGKFRTAGVRTGSFRFPWHPLPPS